MIAVVYTSFLDASLSGDISLRDDPIAGLLATAAYQPRHSHVTLGDVRGEVEGPGYASGGRLLTDKRVEKGVFRAADLVWPDATIQKARWVVLYSNQGSKPLVCCLALDGEASSRNHEFCVRWDARGILDLQRE